MLKVFKGVLMLMMHYIILNLFSERARFGMELSMMHARSLTPERDLFLQGSLMSQQRLDFLDDGLDLR